MFQPPLTALAHFQTRATLRRCCRGSKTDFPLYLAPMAGITDTTFRQLCKGYGADVMVSEFVSAEGIFRRNERTMEYLDFEEAERPDVTAQKARPAFRAPPKR